MVEASLQSSATSVPDNGRLSARPGHHPMQRDGLATPHGARSRPVSVDSSAWSADRRDCGRAPPLPREADRRARPGPVGNRTARRGQDRAGPIGVAWSPRRSRIGRRAWSAPPPRGIGKVGPSPVHDHAGRLVGSPRGQSCGREGRSVMVRHPARSPRDDAGATSRTTAGRAGRATLGVLISAERQGVRWSPRRRRSGGEPACTPIEGDLVGRVAVTRMRPCDAVEVSRLDPVRRGRCRGSVAR